MVTRLLFLVLLGHNLLNASSEDNDTEQTSAQPSEALALCQQICHVNGLAMKEMAVDMQQYNKSCICH